MSGSGPIRWNGRLPPCRAVRRRKLSPQDVRHCRLGSPAGKETQMEPTTIAIDLAKRVFQIHYVESGTGTIHSKVLKRAQLVPFFANRPASRVVMEACGSAHHWARVLTRLGHDVRLIAAQFVRPFVM